MCRFVIPPVENACEFVAYGAPFVIDGFNASAVAYPGHSTLLLIAGLRRVLSAI